MDLLFPGSVLLLKFIFKLTIEQEVKTADASKALLNFPLDLAFLAFSFAAAILYAVPPTEINAGSVKSMFGILISAIVVLALITLTCKKSDRAYTLENLKMAAVLAVFSYVLAGAVLIAAFNISGLVS